MPARIGRSNLGIRSRAIVLTAISDSAGHLLGGPFRAPGAAIISYCAQPMERTGKTPGQLRNTGATIGSPQPKLDLRLPALESCGPRMEAGSGSPSISAK